MSASAPLSEAVAIIDKSGAQICLVVDECDRLLGTITDGDVRRAILRSLPLTTPATAVMNPRPTTVDPGQPREAVLDLMRERRIHQVPMVEADGRVVGLVLLDNLLAAVPTPVPNWVVLMAGG
ncbi:MAG TPA: CBS domain-containing protein, partial [Candidatus Omnitrophota bacterium]|nr:CBS domain-containing protein [Candidatus Omnitrophota bacterium]